MCARYILLSESEKVGIENWLSRGVFVLFFYFLFFLAGREGERIYILVHTYGPRVVSFLRRFSSTLWF